MGKLDSYCLKGHGVSFWVLKEFQNGGDSLTTF